MSHTKIKACECPRLDHPVLKSLERDSFSGAPFVETISLDLCNVYWDPEWEKNQIRQAGTQKLDKEAILEDLRKGIRYNEIPPIVIFNKKENRWELKDGFHRIWALKQLQQKTWIFDVHEYDITSSFNPEKYTEGDIDVDMKLGANCHAPSKSCDKKDFLSAGVEKVNRGSVDKTMDGIREWVKSIPNNFSKKVIETITTNIYKATVSINKIRSLDLDKAKEIITNKTKYTVGGDIDGDNNLGRVINASNDLYTLRAFKMLLQDYVKHGKTTNYVFYCSSALDPEDVKQQRNRAKAEADHFHKLCLAYAAKFLTTGVKPYNIVGSLAQIKGVEDNDENKVLVPFPLD